MSVKFVWGPEQQHAFETLKEAMISAPVIRHFDTSKNAILQTDASAFGWGFVVSQISDDGLEHPVFIESGRFDTSEINYSPAEHEFIAIVEAFRRCRHLLLQVHTEVITDHLNLIYWMKPRQLNVRQARWTTEVNPFDFVITYRPGIQAALPDGLSRNADFMRGKGATYRLKENFMQALPMFGVRNRPEEMILRALQPSHALKRDYWIGGPAGD